jgi:CRP-like cAMP-binding protein
MLKTLHSVYSHPFIPEEDLQAICDKHEKQSFKKNEFILKKGKIANEYYILESGLARAFVYDFDGNEITTEFFCDKELVIVPTSLFQRIPSIENVQAITDCTAWKISFEDFQELFHRMPGFMEWGRSWFSLQLFAQKQRSLEMITETARHRYLSLLEGKPQIIQKAPLKHIASYLGITDTSLSRIRKDTVLK